MRCIIKTALTFRGCVKIIGQQAENNMKAGKELIILMKEILVKNEIHKTSGQTTIPNDEQHG